MKYFENFDVKSIEDMDLYARQVVEGFIIGLHKSPFHGFSVEFAEHRLYNPGESTRNIDWKVYGRTDKMFTKRFEEETNLRCQIVVDTSSSMYFPYQDKDNPINKLQFSALAGASLMNLLKRQRDAFGLSLFDDDLQVHTPAKSSTKHYHLLLSHLDRLIKEEPFNKTSNITDALHAIADQVHKRSLIVIFSDMMDSKDNIDEIFAALQHMKYNKHEVILFHTKDKKYEVDFEFENRPYLFIDAETNEKVKLQAHQVQDYYTTKIKEFNEHIKTKCQQYKIDLIDTNIRDGYHQVLQNYLIKRSKLNFRL